MSFTVQRITSDGQVSSQQKWSVVLNHEHIMFTGNYRQCEDWLDRHDIHVPAANKQATIFERISATVGRFVDRCRLGRVGQSVASFVKNDAGHYGLAESALVGLLVAGLYLGTALASSAIAWDRVAFYGDLHRLPHGTRLPFAPANNCCSTCQGESLDIACDLAPSH
jgi:hypothetical protein